MGANRPTISIVTATFNSSHLLKYAIASVLRSDYENWELLVIGDHCTDNTEACIAGFNDRRIRFTNLAVNSGQQAVPNNVGIAQATGYYVCFLNQDDMFLPWHLSYMLSQIENESAHIICARAAIIEPNGDSDSVTEIRARTLLRSPTKSEFNPRNPHLASTWFMPLAIAHEVGPWKLEHELFTTPSQDWLFRAWRSGKRVTCAQSVSLVILASGQRNNSYLGKRDAEHKFVFHNLVANNYLIPYVLQTVEQDEFSLSRFSWRRLLAHLYYASIGKLLVAMNIHPTIPTLIIKHGAKRGGFVKYWKFQVGISKENPR